MTTPASRAVPFTVVEHKEDTLSAKPFRGGSLAEAIKAEGYEPGDKAVVVSWEWLTTVCAGLKALREKGP